MKIFHIFVLLSVVSFPVAAKAVSERFVSKCRSCSIFIVAHSTLPKCMNVGIYIVGMGVRLDHYHKKFSSVFLKPRSVYAQVADDQANVGSFYNKLRSGGDVMLFGGRRRAAWLWRFWRNK
jgi:hypothetical protein